MATQELDLDGDGRTKPVEARKPPRPKRSFRVKLHPGTATPLVPRRKKMVVARLGRRRGWLCRGRHAVSGILRRLRLQWLTDQYRKALKKLRQYHETIVRDMIEGNASLDAAQSRAMMQPVLFANPFLTPMPSIGRAYY